MEENGIKVYDLEHRDNTISTFGEIMFDIRHRLYEMSESNEVLSRDLAKAFAQDGWKFRYYRFMKGIGLREYGDSGIEGIVRSRPRLLQHLMNQQHMLLNRRIDNTKKYLGLIADERNKLLRHVRYLHEDGRRLIASSHEMEDGEKSLSSSYEQIVHELREKEEAFKPGDLILEERLQESREKEIAGKLSLEEMRRNMQNASMRRNTLYNANGTARVLIEQMDLSYAQVDLMRETLEAQKDYSRTVLEGQMALGIVLEDVEKVVENYSAYAQICGKLLLGINVGIQTVLGRLVETVSKPLYEKEHLEESARVCAESMQTLDSYRKSAHTLASNAGREYDNIRHLLTGIDNTVKRLEPYAPAVDVKRYDELVVR